MASIMVVGVLIIILSLITVGFARLMNRELNQSLNTQLATAATLAAESGINDALTLVRDSPDLTIDECQTGINTLNTNLGPNTNILSTDTKYTCLLIDPSPTDIRFDSIPVDTSQIVKLTPKNGNIDMLMFSWEASNNTSNNYDASVGSPLLSEPDWNSHDKAPVLRVSLYPVSLNGSLAPIANQKTYFFYPEVDGGSTNVTNSDYNLDGQLIGVRCGDTVKTLTAGFVDSADYKCNIIITNVDSSGGQTYYAKITPIYTDARVKIKGDTQPPISTIEFIGAQTLVDVTAKATDSVKRLQARANVTDKVNNIANASEKTVPEYALRSAGTLCKRLIIPSDGTQIYTDPSIGGSSCNVVVLPPPTLNLYLNNDPNLKNITVNPGNSATIYWTTTNATRCDTTGAWNGPGPRPVSGNESTGVLNHSATYVYTMECYNALNVSSGTQSVSVNVIPPCPAPTAHTLNPFGITENSAYINGQVDPGSCTGLFSFFEWNQGSTLNASPNQTGNVPLTPNGGNQTSTPQLTGLSPSTQYTYRICVTYGGICGLPITFTTPAVGDPGGGPGSPDCVITSFSMPGDVGGQFPPGGYTASGTFSHCYNNCSGFGTFSGGISINYSGNISSDNNVPASGGISAGSTAGWGGVRCYGNNGSTSEVALYASGGGGGSGCSNGATNPPACDNGGGGGPGPCGPGYSPPGCTGSPTNIPGARGCDWDWDGNIDDSTPAGQCGNFGGNYLVLPDRCRWPNGAETVGAC